MSTDELDANAPLALRREGDASDPIVVAAGEIDVATAPALRDLLTEVIATGPRTVTVDLARVEFIDSSGLGVLVGALKQLQAEHDGSLHVRDPQPAVRKVFEITGLASELGLG